MAMNEEQQLILEKVKADFPSLTGEQALKLTAIMSHEGGLKGKPEYFQYRSPKALKNLTASFSGKASVKRRFEKAKADAIAQNKIIRAQNEKIERKSDKLKEVPVPSSSKQWLLGWNADLQKRYKDKTITADQYRKEFFDTVYEDIGGADYAGIGSIQVTGKQNLFDALKTQGEVGAQYLKILNDDPSAINSLKQNKDFLDIVTKGWIQKDLINTKKIDKPIETVIDTVNAGEVKANKIKKAETYNTILKDYNTPAPKTSDQQIPYPVTQQGVAMSPADIRNYTYERDVRNYSGMEPGIQEAMAMQEPQYMSMEDLLMDKDLTKNPLLLDKQDAETMWRQF